jgi:hypothetical protein
MRRHSRFARLAHRIDRAFFSRAANADNLVAGRLEPAFAPRFECWIDLIFMHEDRVALLPFVQVEGPMLLLRESSPLLWPSWLPIDPTAVEGLEALVEPWLRSLAAFDATDTEALRIFRNDEPTRALIETARADRLLGAAPIEAVLTDAAPYLYAQRFAANRRLGIRSPDGATGAAILTALAGSVRADLCDQRRNDFARTWFDADIYGSAVTEIDIAIEPGLRNEIATSIALNGDAQGGTRIAFVRPAFPSIACSFDPNDAAPVRHFSVRAPEPTLHASRLVAAPIVGGSRGRIGIIVRDDGLRVPEADVDQAQALAAALRAQEFEASVVVASAAQAEQYDLLHFFGHRHAAQFAPLLAQARTRDIPVVVSPALDDFEHHGAWGSSIVGLLTVMLFDDAYIATLEAQLAQRRLEVGDGVPRGTVAYDENALRAMLAQARAAVFASETEERRAREHLGFRGASRCVPSVGVAELGFEPVGALCGFDDYLLMHAAFQPRANQAALLLAAAQAALPCVLVGSVEDGDYYQSALSRAGPLAVWLPQEALTPQQLAAVYAGARVYADLSWFGYGADRIVRAAAYGCGLVISSALQLDAVWPGIAEVVDPANMPGHAAALRRAWDRAPALAPIVAGRTAELCDPLRSLQAILGSYADATAVRSV